MSASFHQKRRCGRDDVSVGLGHLHRPFRLRPEYGATPWKPLQMPPSTLLWKWSRDTPANRP